MSRAVTIVVCTGLYQSLYKWNNYLLRTIQNIHDHPFKTPSNIYQVPFSQSVTILAVVYTM